MPMRYRQATLHDAAAVAALHADSWRTHYRGAYRDEYLDGDIVKDRLNVWQQRLSDPPANQFVVLAEDDGELVGFACAYGAHDDTWGTLLDNIHVSTELHRSGIGSGLMNEVMAWCRANYADVGLYLWVLHQNDRARSFYQQHGGSDQGGEFGTASAGGGQIHRHRYAWKSIPDAPMK